MDLPREDGPWLAPRGLAKPHYPTLFPAHRDQPEGAAVGSSYTLVLATTTGSLDWSQLAGNQYGHKSYHDKLFEGAEG